MTSCCLLSPFQLHLEKNNLNQNNGGGESAGNQDKNHNKEAIETAKSAPMLSSSHDNDLLASLNNPKKGDKKTNESVETLNFVGNNGEIISHSDFNSSNLGPTQPLDANAAIQKTIQLADHLKAARGGSAKLHIQDPELGKISLQVDMKNPSSVSVTIHTESADVKRKIEDKMEFLKQSLELQKITLSDFKVTSVDKAMASQFNQSGNQGQSSQNQSAYYNPNAGSQFNSNQNNSGFNSNFNQESSNFMNDESALKSASNNKYKNVQKNSITNIQRSANGSIKVLA